MDVTGNSPQAELTRTGRRSGCSCCGFTAFGIIAGPILALVILFVAL
jgi:hypothetical protein